jgi:predicted amidohydrolase YtcJ
LPELVIRGGPVWTGNPAQPWAEAIGVRDGRISAVGSETDVRSASGPGVEVIDAAGGLVIPGVVDAHIHPPMAGIERARCDLTGVIEREDAVAAVAAYAAAHPEVEWIRGGGWSMAGFPNGLPVASDLDRAVGARPVYLPNRDHHSAWVSSKALELAGITAGTPDPPDGRIERDGAGAPTGALHDGAMSLVERVLPPLTAEDHVEGLLVAQRYLHSLGITSWQDAWVPLYDDRRAAFEAYLSLASSGRLTARVVGALWWERDRGEDQVEGLLAAREEAAAIGSDRFRATSVKIMQDGVCETFTAAMLTPYLDVHGHESGGCGLSFVDPEALKGYVRRLDAEGFQVHVHAIGDRAVREALDAIEVASAARVPGGGGAGGGAGGRHHLAHLQVVHPDDLPRFASLGVTANFQPLWACEDDQMVELTTPFLGEERAAWQYPIGSLARRGVSLAFGSDWPVSTPDPMAELHVAVNRTPAGSSGSGAEARHPWLPNERISLDEALSAFTRGSAYVNHLEEECGSIEPGKQADVAVLDRNVFATDNADGGIAAAEVRLTMVGGEVVFERQ